MITAKISAPVAADNSVSLPEAGPRTDAHAAAWKKFVPLPMPARTDEACFDEYGGMA